MERLATPLKKGTKAYLTKEVAPSLTDALTRLGILRPDDPFMFLAEYMLNLSPQHSDFVLIKKVELEELITRRVEEARVEITKAFEEKAHTDNTSPAGSAFHAVKSLSSQPLESSSPDAQSTRPLLLRQGTEGGGGELGHFSARTAQSTDSLKANVGEEHQSHSVALFEDVEEEKDNDGETTNLQNTHKISMESSYKEEPKDGGEEEHNEEKDHAQTDEQGMKSEAELVPNETPSEGQVINSSLSKAEPNEEEQRPEEAVLEVTDERTSMRRQVPETAQQFKVGLHVDGRYVLAKVAVEISEGIFILDGFDIKAQEQYYFECEGVDYEALAEKKNDIEEVVKEIASALRFIQDPETGVLILGMQ